MKVPTTNKPKNTSKGAAKPVSNSVPKPGSKDPATDSSLELAQAAADLADDVKALGITILELRDVSSVADYFVIASGRSHIQVEAICDHVAEGVRDRLGRRPIAVEGLAQALWGILDYGSVVVHVFQENVRELYDLERLWSLAPRWRHEDGPPTAGKNAGTKTAPPEAAAAKTSATKASATKTSPAKASAKASPAKASAKTSRAKASEKTSPAKAFKKSASAKKSTAKAAPAKNASAKNPPEKTPPEKKAPVKKAAATKATKAAAAKPAPTKPAPKAPGRKRTAAED